MKSLRFALFVNFLLLWITKMHLEINIFKWDSFGPGMDESNHIMSCPEYSRNTVSLSNQHMPWLLLSLDVIPYMFVYRKGNLYMCAVSPWWKLLELLPSCPFFWSSHCTSFENQVSEDEMCEINITGPSNELSDLSRIGGDHDNSPITGHQVHTLSYQSHDNHIMITGKSIAISRMERLCLLCHSLSGAPFTNLDK